MQGTIAAPSARPASSAVGLVEKLNTRYHKIGLRIFMFIVVAHLAEHAVQAVQIWGLGWERKAARGVLGFWFPWLVKSESLHYGYAIIMLIGLLLFRPGFAGRARTWWNIALGIQVWHHFEHLFLLGQVAFGMNFLGRPQPTSFAQLAVMRVELHLLYNTLVLIPMLIAMAYHIWPSPQDRAQVQCTCAVESRRAEPALAHSH